MVPHLSKEQQTLINGRVTMKGKQGSTPSPLPATQLHVNPTPPTATHSYSYKPGIQESMCPDLLHSKKPSLTSSNTDKTQHGGLASHKNALFFRWMDDARVVFQKKRLDFKSAYVIGR